MSHTIKTRVTTEITITLTEGEARALDAICGYGADIFLKWFHKTHGKHYIQDHEVHLTSLFAKGRSLGAAFYEIEKARAALLNVTKQKDAPPVPVPRPWWKWRMKLLKTKTA